MYIHVYTCTHIQVLYLHTSKQHGSSHSEYGALWRGETGQFVVVVHRMLEEEGYLNVQQLHEYTYNVHGEGGGGCKIK